MNQDFELLYKNAEEYSKKIAHLKNQIWQLEKENVIRVKVEIETSYGRKSEPVVVSMDSNNRDKIIELCLRQLYVDKENEICNLIECKDKMKSKIDEI